MIRVWAIRNIDQTDVTWSYVRPITWSGVEISIGITCACLPILQPLLQATFGRCYGRILGSSNNINNRSARNLYGKGGEQISHAEHGRPQMSRRATGDFAMFNQRVERKPPVNVMSTWSSAEGGEGGSDDGIPLQGIQVTKEVEMEVEAADGV